MRPPFRDGVIRPMDGDAADRAERRRQETPESLPTAPSCPFCEGIETEIMNQFGAHASVSSYWCRACGSPFELMKWRGGA